MPRITGCCRPALDRTAAVASVAAPTVGPLVLIVHIAQTVYPFAVWLLAQRRDIRISVRHRQGKSR